MTGQIRFRIYLLLLVVFTVFVTILSLRTFSAPFDISNQDKVGHYIAYATLAWLACQALVSRLQYLTVLILAFLYASATGAILELMQAYLTSTRQGDWSDFLANLLGALTGCVVFSLMHRIKQTNECNETD